MNWWMKKGLRVIENLRTGKTGNIDRKLLKVLLLGCWVLVGAGLGWADSHNQTPGNSFVAPPFQKEGRWFKGNLHVHVPDGKLEPDILEKTVSPWKKAGFDFIVLSSHAGPYKQILPADTVSSETFLVISGLEVGSPHLVCVNVQDLMRDEKTGRWPPNEQLIEMTRKQEGEVILAHPYWSGLTSMDIFNMDVIAMEIYNRCTASIERGAPEVFWDELLRKGKKIWAVAVEDSHPRIQEPDLIPKPETFVMVKAKELKVASIVQALREGSFYSSRGPLIENGEWTEHVPESHPDRNPKIKYRGRLTIKTSPVQEIVFIGQSYWERKTRRASGKGTITEAEFLVPKSASWIRVECIDSMGRKAWTNPFYF